MRIFIVVHIFIMIMRVNSEFKNWEAWAIQLQYIFSRVNQEISTFFPSILTQHFKNWRFFFIQFSDSLAPNSLRAETGLIG